ncbi:hypothetical protein JXL21_01970 [Candidatus Bathyarchaeota archaeon]|nr:hypothetical protein [Candidatus Bathyarchaeota archaeon]
MIVAYVAVVSFVSLASLPLLANALPVAETVGSTVSAVTYYYTARTLLFGSLLVSAVNMGLAAYVWRKAD